MLLFLIFQISVLLFDLLLISVQLLDLFLIFILLLIIIFQLLLNLLILTNRQYFEPFIYLLFLIFLFQLFYQVLPNSLETLVIEIRQFRLLYHSRTINSLIQIQLLKQLQVILISAIRDLPFLNIIQTIHLSHFHKL